MSRSKPTKAEQQERAEALDHLRAILQPGDTVHAIIRKVAPSGMSRTIDFYKSTNDGMVYLTGWMHAAGIGDGRTDRGALRVSGCGMDMAFHCTYTLARMLWPDGFTCTGDRADSRRRCPSNDHSNGDRNYTPHTHSDGGYALTSEIL